MCKSIDGKRFGGELAHTGFAGFEPTLLGSKPKELPLLKNPKIKVVPRFN